MTRSKATRRRVSKNKAERYWRQLMGAPIHKARVRSECIVRGRKITMRHMKLGAFIRAFIQGHMEIEQHVNDITEHWRELGSMMSRTNDMVDAMVYTARSL